MNRLRCFFLATIVVISSATLALGGDIQAPGIAAPAPTPTNALMTASTDGLTQPASTEGIQISWQDEATAILVDILLTIF